MEDTLVSVLMTAYNRQQFIAEAIESVISSSYKKFELIIVDDCSADRTVEIAKGYEAKDSRVKVYVNEKNLGDYENRNKAARLATGKYLKYLDSDDMIYPWGLEVMVYCMETNPQVGIGFTSNVALDIKYPLVLQPTEAYKMYYFRNLVMGIGPTGAIIRKDIFESFKGFSGRQFIGDTELWLKITQQNTAVWMPPGLFFWRTHANQQIVLEHKNFEIEKIRYQLNKHYLSADQCPLSKVDSNTALRNLTNIKCRSIIKGFINGKISASQLRIKKLGLTTNDFCQAVNKNKIPIDMPSY